MYTMLLASTPKPPLRYVNGVEGERKRWRTRGRVLILNRVLSNSTKFYFTLSIPEAMTEYFLYILESAAKLSPVYDYV